MSESYHSVKRDGSSKGEIEFPTVFFTNSVKNVMHTMTGMEATEVNPQKEDNEDYLSQVSGITLLIGERNIMISLVMSRITAAAIVSFMTGIQPSVLQEEEICDGVAELTHMIAGETKSQLKSREYRLMTLPPFTIIGDRYKLIHRSKVIHLVKRYRIAENDILLKVYCI